MDPNNYFNTPWFSNLMVPNKYQYMMGITILILIEKALWFKNSYSVLIPFSLIYHFNIDIKQCWTESPSFDTTQVYIMRMFQNYKKNSLAHLWPRHSMMLVVTVLLLCCEKAFAAAFRHNNDPANAPTIVGLLDILSIEIKDFQYKMALRPPSSW